MLFLLRVGLPDVPGSLGRVASAIGLAGGDIEAIEIVSHGPDGIAVDDVLLEMVPGAMPDSVISACNELDGVEVLWISRYAAGGNLFLDLEVVEALTADPAQALDRVVDLLPVTFRVSWGARVTTDDYGEPLVVRATEGAPESFDWVKRDWLGIDSACGLEEIDDVTLLAAAPMDDDIVIVGRDGGPEFLDSELARLSHLIGLAVSISR